MKQIVTEDQVEKLRLSIASRLHAITSRTERMALGNTALIDNPDFYRLMVEHDELLKRDNELLDKLDCFLE